MDISNRDIQEIIRKNKMFSGDLDRFSLVEDGDRIDFFVDGTKLTARADADKKWHNLFGMPSGTRLIAFNNLDSRYRVKGGNYSVANGIDIMFCGNGIYNTKDGFVTTAVDIDINTRETWGVLLMYATKIGAGNVTTKKSWLIRWKIGTTPRSAEVKFRDVIVLVVKNKIRLYSADGLKIGFLLDDVLFEIRGYLEENRNGRMMYETLCKDVGAKGYMPVIQFLRNGGIRIA